jgi:hypothetical protein
LGRAETVESRMGGRGRDASCPAPPAQVPACVFHTGLLSKVRRNRHSGLGSPIQLRCVGSLLQTCLIRRCVRDMRCLSPSLRSTAFPPQPPPLLTRQHCSALPRYYAVVRLLGSSTAATPPRLPSAARDRLSDCGRDEVSQVPTRSFLHVMCSPTPAGRTTPRLTASPVLRSTLPTASAPASTQFRGSIAHPMQLLCTLHERRRRHSCNTR